MVRAVWKQAGMEPYGGRICVGCLENAGTKTSPKHSTRLRAHLSPQLVLWLTAFASHCCFSPMPPTHSAVANN
jgi:hypothetical protein